MVLSEQVVQRPGSKLLIIVLIAGFLLLPPVYTTSRIGIQAIFNFFQQDTFYYLAVAENSVSGFYTFDGEKPTNGFHPLWQYLLTLLFNVLPPQDQALQITVVFWISVVLTITGFCLSGLAVFRITRSVVLSVLMVPGLLNLAFGFILRFGGSPWKYMNGMESGLSVLFGGILLYLIAVHYGNASLSIRNRAFLLGLGIVTGLLIMARLDDGFLLPALCLSIALWQEEPVVERLKKGIIVCIPAVCLLIPYMAFNYYSAGTALPVSGLEKGGFSLWENLRILVGLLFPEPFEPGTVYADLYASQVYKEAVLWSCLVLAGLFWGLLWRGVDKGRFAKDQMPLISGLLLYVVLKVLYNLLFVHLNHQGLWYFVLATVVLNFVALLLIAKSPLQLDGQSTFVKAASVIAVVLYLAFYLAIVYKGAFYPASKVYALWKDRSRVSQYLLAQKPDIGLVEIDDGFIGYSLGIPAIHGMGFAVDYEGFLAMQAGRFLQYCYARGFNTIASVQYLPIRAPEMKSDQLASILNSTYWLFRESCKDYEFRVLLYDPRSGAVFVEFSPSRPLGGKNRSSQTLFLAEMNSGTPCREAQ